MKSIIDQNLFEKILRLRFAGTMRKTPLIIGRHGIGKSEIARSVASAMLPNHKVHVLMLGQMSDPGDLIGILRPDGTYQKPYWFDPLQPVCLILDEVNRCRPEIQQAAFDLILNLSLMGESLATGSTSLALANLGEGYFTSEIDDRALESRFNIYWFEQSTMRVLEHFKSIGIDDRIIAFLQKFPSECIGKISVQQEPFTPTADPRNWVEVSGLIQGQEIDDEMTQLLLGVVGSSAFEFHRFCNRGGKIGAGEIFGSESWSDVVFELSLLETMDLIALSASIVQFLRDTETHKKGKREQIYSAERLAQFAEWLLEMEHFEVIGALVQAIQSEHGQFYLYHDLRINAVMEIYLQQAGSNLD